MPTALPAAPHWRQVAVSALFRRPPAGWARIALGLLAQLVTAACASGAARASSRAVCARHGLAMATIHRVKRILFLGREVPVLLQNENGPCPLLAICALAAHAGRHCMPRPTMRAARAGNVLLLRNAIRIRAETTEVSAEVLVEIVANYLLEANPPVCC